MRALLAILLALSSPALTSAALIEGRVVNGDLPQAGIQVMAFANTTPPGEPLARAEPTDAEGIYRLELPAGTYFIAGWNAERSQFAVCGRNPVRVSDNEEPLWLGLQIVPATKPAIVPYQDEYSAAIEGRVLTGGQPLAGAYVSLYLDAAEDLKGQGYRLSLPTGDDGYFRFDGLPESDYFLVARKRQDGARVGPIREGDLFGVYPDNPLTARSGQLAQLDLNLIAKLKDEIRGEHVSAMSGPVIEGTIVDAEGIPVSGLHVFAYTDRVIGHQRPVALSTPSKADGRFTVQLPEAGTYYIGARQHYGDSPAPGELFGMYDESADHGLTLDRDESRDKLRIVVEPVAIF